MPAKNPRTFSRIETGDGMLNASGVATITFAAIFESIPVINMVEKLDSPNDNVALIITAASRTGFTVNASAAYIAGQVFYYHAIG